MKSKHLKIILYFAFIMTLSFNVCASPKGTKFSKGFKTDDYGYKSFYCDEDKFYNDGWHLLDANGDGLYGYYYFTISGHYLISNVAPNGCLLNENGLLLNVDNTIYQVSFSDCKTR